MVAEEEAGMLGQRVCDGLVVPTNERFGSP